MKSCAIASADRKVNIKTVVKLTCLLFVFFVSTHNAWSVPDLIIEADQTEIGNTTIAPGASFDVTTSVWNQGKSVSEATHLGYYITTDTVLSLENTVAVLGVKAVKSLAGAGTHPRNRRSVLSKTLTLPADLAPGSYFLMMYIFPVGAEDASNNSQAIEITGTAPPPVEPPDAESGPDMPSGNGPDLVIDGVRVDAATVKVFGGVRMHIVIQNQGTIRAPATMLEFYRSLDATISTEDTLLRSMPIGQLDKGRITATHTVLPGALETGKYYYGVCITPVEGESNTTNNCSEAIEIEFVRGDENLPLQIRGQILKREFDVGDDAEVFDVKNYFTRKVETYTASSDDATIATAVMSGSEVTVTPIAEGWTTIRIRAQDDEDVAEQRFIAAVGAVEVPEVEVPEAEVVLDTSPEVSIPDAGLRAAIRSRLGLEAGDPLTEQKMRQLTTLIARETDITDLTGLEHAVNLTRLTLSDSEIVDISAVGNLTKLTNLDLADNQIIDVKPLENLTNLTTLWLERNLISDVSPLENLTKLTHLYLEDNDITDLAPLRRLREKNPHIQFDILIPAGAPSLRILPTETALLSNYPNPFNPETWIPYHLATPTDVTVTIYDLRGVVIRRLAIGHQPAGVYQRQGRAAHWDGRNALGEPVASGVYFYTLIAGDFTATKKLLIRK